MVMDSTGVYRKPIYNLLEGTGIQPLAARVTNEPWAPVETRSARDFRECE